MGGGNHHSGPRHHFPDRGPLLANILIVDDDPIAISVVRDALQPLDHFVYAAEDWSSMNEELFQRPYAVIVLDVNLPGLKGDTLARIVTKSLDPKPKVLLYSGMEERELRRLARKVGATGYMTKGCSEASMVRTVEAALEAFATDHMEGQHATRAKAALSSAPPRPLAPTLEEFSSKAPKKRSTPPKAGSNPPADSGDDDADVSSPGPPRVRFKI